MVTIPTLKELYDDIIDDIEADFGATIPLFGKSFIRVMAGVQAAKLKLFYLALGNVQKNIFVDTADRESKGGTLERFGRAKLGRDPFAAVAGVYTAEVTGSVAAVIPAGTTFKSDDDSANPGFIFRLDTEKTLTAGTDTISLRALTAGLDSQLEVGDTLTATAPIANVDETATVTVETTEPLAAEDIEEYRRKALAAYQLEPQGGAATDYRLWAADAQGVQEVYPYAKSGAANEINLYVEATTDDSSDGYGTPTSAILDAVEEVVELDPDTTKPINQRGRRPLAVFQIHYLPVSPKPIDIIIASYVDITAAKQASILAAITAAINEVRPFISGADVLSEKNDILDKNKIVATILEAVPGSIFGAITLKVDSVSVSTYTFSDGNIPYFNSIAYS